jgi:glycosyltransferase involved in cell wall biosynthesis
VRQGVAHSPNRGCIASAGPGNVSGDAAHSGSTTMRNAMSRIRVLHLVVGGDVGGAERLLVDLARRPDVARADQEVALFTPNPRLRSLFRDAGLVLHDRGHAREDAFSFLRRSLGSADVAWLVELLRGERFDALHTHTFGTHVLGTRAARRAGVPQLRTEHHVMHYFDPSCIPFTRWAASRTERFVAISGYVMSTLRRVAPDAASRTRVVLNGVDVAHWTPRPKERDGFSAAIVCRLTGWKRVDLAIEAARIARVELVVVGDGEERIRLEGLARSKGANVRFVGHQADPRPFLAQADITLNTSKSEPLGLSVLESLAMERPVIAFREGGLVEVVQDGETGWLVERADAPSLARAMTLAHERKDEIARMGKAGRRFVVEHASIERMCEGYAREYEDLVK